MPSGNSYISESQKGKEVKKPMIWRCIEKIICLLLILYYPNRAYSFERNLTQGQNLLKIWKYNYS